MRTVDATGYHYKWVDVAIDASARQATLTVTAPAADAAVAQTIPAILAQGDAWWPLAMARELDDAILMLRTNDLEVGTWVLRTRGSNSAMQAIDKVLH